LHDFIFDSFVVTPVLTLPSPWLHTNSRLHGDGKVNTGVTTKLSKIKSCNRIVKAYEKNNIYRHLN
jgi:hypothetical protein